MPSCVFDSMKDREYNGQKTEGQRIQWSKDRRTENTMVKRQKDREYNGQQEQKDEWKHKDIQNTAQKTTVSRSQYMQSFCRLFVYVLALERRIRIQFADFTPPYFCSYPKPGPELPTSYGMVFCMFNEMR